MNRIKVIFNNNIQIDGEMLEFRDDRMIVQADDGIRTIIPSVSNSVIFYQIPPETENIVNVLPKKPLPSQHSAQEAIRVHPTFARELRKVFQ